ncbi:MAG: hypothetical protein ACLRPZ_03875 [Coprococcus sp.]
MRKVIFKIDDKEYLRRDLKRQNCTGSQAEDILKNLNNFKAIYTLYGNKKQVDRYELTDYDGNKININDLNGYEKGVVLNDCYAYFVGEKYCFDSDKPCGVVDIVEEEIE